MADYRCDRCQWATPVTGVSHLWTCRKDTPRISEGSTFGLWPTVRLDDWCGHFSPKRQAPWTATVQEPQP